MSKPQCPRLPSRLRLLNRTHSSKTLKNKKNPTLVEAIPTLPMAGAMQVTTTVSVSGIPPAAIAQELSDFFESEVGPVFACEIFTVHKNWKSRGSGRVQFESTGAAERALTLLAEGNLRAFQNASLALSWSFDDIIPRPADPRNRVGGTVLRVGYLVGEREMEVLDSWEGVGAELMPEKRRLDLFVEQGGERYKMEIMLGDVDGSFKCSVDGGETNSLLLKLKYAPRIYQGISGPTLTPKFSIDRYHVCKEDLQFLWVRTIDFSVSCSIGQSSYFCLGLPGELLTSGIVNSFPFYEELGDLTTTKGKACHSLSELAPLISCPSNPSFAYEVLFQLNSLVHAQKISFGQVDANLFQTLSCLTADTAQQILFKLHKMKSSCYDPVGFIRNQLGMRGNRKNPLSSNNMSARNLMSCHRVLVTPAKLHFLGPELEVSNYVVNHYAAHASDFVRVSFVEEDWSKLPSDAISTRIELGVFSEPYRTGIYNRILTILRDGISIGAKRFEFLAFSASQLRGNSVWMFASNDTITADNIRQWMGDFKKIRNVSKCAARMGQLFSSSMQTFSVPPQEVQIIPDIEVSTDGIKYCFSDGIGKISLSFARQVSLKCGLSHIPSAFQIRYGGYKGVVAVDRNSFRKLSLRPSMLKFDSHNTMFSVTKWSDYMKCYLNREIICLLSTLGVEDKVFENLQHEYICDLNDMLKSKEAALEVLDTMAGADTKTAVKMLMQGYDPNSEPYLSMLLKAHLEYQLSDIRTKCRVLVPRGRVLIGCLDESCKLDYGQVYVRVTMTSAELKDKDQAFFKKIDEKTAVVIGKIVVTKNPCLHPGDIRVLEAVYECALEEKCLVDCIIFPQKGERPHPNECSGGDLDGDLYFVSWDENLIPPRTVTPMDYIGRRPRILDHEVTLQEIQKFFVDYMINDTLGSISTSHLVHADCEPCKAESPECLQLAKLHSMAVDFAKTGAPAEMPRILRPKVYPDFMERQDRPMYVSNGVLGKLYRGAMCHLESQSCDSVQSESLVEVDYDHDLEVKGFEAFVEAAEEYRNQYAEKLGALMSYYGAVHEEEILMGNLRNRQMYLQRDRKRYGEVKDRILVSVRNLHKEVESWFRNCCNERDRPKMASAWYHVTYHPNYFSDTNFLSFPWILCDVLLSIKSSKCIMNKDHRTIIVQM